MRRNLSNTLLTILALVLALAAVSCSSEMEKGILVEARLSISIEDDQARGLATDALYTAAFTPVTYEYKAACSSNAEAKGVQSTWKEISVSDSSASIPGMEMGTWTIHMRARNANGGVIYQGSASGIQLSSSSRTFSIALKDSVTDYSVASPANVTIALGVTVPTVTGASLNVRYTTAANIASLNAGGTYGTSVSMSSAANKRTAISGSSVTYSTTATGYTAYYQNVSLAPGRYVFQILYKDSGGQVVSGYVIPVFVKELSPYAINGELMPGEYIDLSLSTLNISSNDVTVNFSTTPSGYAGGHITAAVSYTGTLTSPTYRWYVNGVLDSSQTSSSYTSTATYDAGQYSIVCIVKGTRDSVTAMGMAKTTVTLSLPKITFNGNGGTASVAAQYVPYNTTSTISATATRSGYRFAGWGTTTSGGTVYGENGNGTNTTITRTSDITLYAQWFQMGTLSSTNDSYEDGVYNCTAGESYTVTYTPVTAASSYSWTVVGDTVGTITNGVDGNVIPTSGSSGTLTLTEPDTYTVTCTAIKNGYRFESSIDFRFYSVEPKAPDNYFTPVIGYREDNYGYTDNAYVGITIHYVDGTNFTYTITGYGQSLEILNAPGCLTYVRTEETGTGPLRLYYHYYTYTEAGVTTSEMAFIYNRSGDPIDI